MRYYSDHLKKFFETEEACLAAEEAYIKAEQDKESEREVMAKEIECAYSDLQKAIENYSHARTVYRKLMNEYIARYGTTYTNFVKYLKDLTD